MLSRYHVAFKQVTSAGGTHPSGSEAVFDNMRIFLRQLWWTLMLNSTGSVQKLGLSYIPSP